MDLQERQRRAELLRGREVRRITSTRLETRSADGVLEIQGLASRTGVPYDMGWYEETMAPGSFATTLSQKPDVQLLINHEGLPLARTTIAAGQLGSLSLSESGDGLEFSARLDATDPDVARMDSKVRSGLMDQCSFAFRVLRQKWTWVEDEAAAADQKDQREIQEVSLDRGDVSVVNYGANPYTAVSVRSMFSELSDEEIDELREDPQIIAIVKRLAVPAPAVGEIEVKTEPTLEEVRRVLDTYKARVFALSH